MSKDLPDTFVLDAITLQGFGSYISPARLDLKPFTILCGKNGSGKSTWLKALRVLKDSMASGQLPYAFHSTDWSTNNIQITNAFYHLGSPDSSRSDEDRNLAHGNPGGIGLEFHYENGSGDSSSAVSLMEAAQNYFYQGVLKNHMRFKILLAHPTHRSDHEETPELQHIISLTINDCYCVRLLGERDPLQRFEEGISRPRRSKPYRIQIGFARENQDRSAPSFTFMDCGIVQNLIEQKIQPCFGEVDEPFLNQVLKCLETRLADLLKSVIESCFILDSIRPHQLSISLESVTTARERLKYYTKKDVGYHGEYAWQIAIDNECLRMGNFARIQFTSSDAGILRSVFASAHLRENEPKIGWIYSQLPKEQQEFFAKAFSPIAIDNETIASWFNALLLNRNVWNQSYWEDVEPSAYPEQEDHRFISNPTIASIVEIGVESFTDDDWSVLVYLAIIDAIWDLGDEFLPSNEICYFREYLSWWVKRFLEIEYLPSTPDKSRFPSDVKKLLNKRDPFRLFDRPTLFCARNSYSYSRDRDLSRLHSPCFGPERPETRQPPRQFSSAFHQIFPMIVQLGMMQPGELFGIENPEVHLHPSLQVQVTEMLLDHAKSGRRIIVETHSDLVLRRTIRAILEEEIPQSAVGIYCVNLNDHRETTVQGERAMFVGSTLETIRVDDKGRIVNWPEGFLDEDIRESQRLLDIMYGRSDEGLDDDA